MVLLFYCFGVISSTFLFDWIH